MAPARCCEKKRSRVKKKLLSFVLRAGLGLGAMPGAFAQTFPEAMDYVMQMQNSIQSNSNPGRASDIHNNIKKSNVLVNTVGIAARIPILSDDTRLEIAGVTGNAQYSGQHQFDHQPKYFDASFHWRAGELLDGKVGYEHESRRYESDQIWPNSDTVTTRRLSAEVGVNLSEGLTLPIIKIFNEKARYGTTQNQLLFDYAEKGWEIAAKYESVTGSSVAVGVQHSQSTYPLRNQLNRPNLDNAFRDREVFTEVYWQYSVKTALYARLGLLNRNYENFSVRNTRLLHLDTQAIWQYSPKTEFRLGLWQRPYNNDEDPNITYSTLRGIGLTARWQATPKLGVALSGAYERQQDTRLGDGQANSTRLRLGPRLVWKANRNVSVILDGYHARKRGDLPSNNYRQNVVRLGVMLQTDNGNEGLAQRLNPTRCGWTHIETALCP